MIHKIDITLSGMQGITTIEDNIGFESKLSDAIPRNNSGYIDFDVLRALENTGVRRCNIISNVVKRTISYPYFGYQSYD